MTGERPSTPRLAPLAGVAAAVLLSLGGVGCSEPVPTPRRPIPSEGGGPAGSASSGMSAKPHGSASAATSAAASAVKPAAEVERPVGVAHAASRVTRVLRSAERDVVVVVFVDDGAASAPTAGVVVLDGPTARVAFRPALDAALLGDGTRVIYGRERPVESASRLGIALVDGAAYEVAGSRRFAQPIVFDVTTGRERALALAGGGTLLARGDEVVAWPRPSHLGAPGKASLLDVETASWRPLPDGAAPEANAKGPPAPTEGAVAHTRDGRLSLHWVDARHLRALRMQPR